MKRKRNMAVMALVGLAVMSCLRTADRQKGSLGWGNLGKEDDRIKQL